jgi:hypothetical protein
MRSLSQFQSALGQALQGDIEPMAPWLEGAPANTPGLAVYRNTVTRGSLDVLASTFSTVVRMVGEDWFRAAAATYLSDHRPSTPSLLHYGADFADWLSSFAPAQDTPYLSAIAHLDRLWWDAYFAAEAGTLDPAVFSQLDAGALETTALVLHPSVRLAAFDYDLASLWLAHRDEAGPAEFEITATPEHVLISRRGLEVSPRLISPAEHAFLLACQRGGSVMTAAGQALAIDPTASLPEIIGAHLAAGRLSGLAPTRPGSEHDH